MSRLTPVALAFLVGPVFAAQLSQQERAITSLKEAGADIVVRSGEVFAVAFSSLKPVANADLKQLRAFPRLKVLSLGGSPKVTDRGLAAVGGLGSLEQLSLAGLQGITDEGLEHLEKLSNLQTLDLSLTPVGDAGLRHLRGLKRLRSVRVTLTKVTDAGVKDLHEALPKVKVNR